MSWDAIGAIGEVVGALGVIVTLVYLSRQISESSRQMKASSSASLNHLINEAFDPHLDPGDRDTRGAESRGPGRLQPLHGAAGPRPDDGLRAS